MQFQPSKLVIQVKALQLGSCSHGRGRLLGSVEAQVCSLWPVQQMTKSQHCARFLVQELMATESSLCSWRAVILAGISSCSWSYSRCPASTPAHTGPGLTWGTTKTGTCMRRAEQLWSPEALWQCGGLASRGGGGCWGKRQDFGQDQGFGPSGPAPHTGAPALSLGVLPQSQEAALQAVDCALQIRVLSRENRDVYTEHSYPKGHVIIKRPEAAG